MEDLIPTQKEKNIFWASASLSVVVGLISGFFSGAFFRIIELLNYDILIILFFFLDAGLFLLIFVIYAVKKIVPVK